MKGIINYFKYPGSRGTGSLTLEDPREKNIKKLDTQGQLLSQYEHTLNAQHTNFLMWKQQYGEAYARKIIENREKYIKPMKKFDRKDKEFKDHKS